MVPLHISFGTIQAYYATIKDSVVADPGVFLPILLSRILVTLYLLVLILVQCILQKGGETTNQKDI